MDPPGLPHRRNSINMCHLLGPISGDANLARCGAGICSVECRWQPRGTGDCPRASRGRRCHRVGVALRRDRPYREGVGLSKTQTRAPGVKRPIAVGLGGVIV